VEHGALSWTSVRRTSFLELIFVVSLLCHFACLIIVVATPSDRAEDDWGGWHRGDAAWRGVAATSPYYGCVHGYPYCPGTATVIRLAGRYDYAPNCGYEYAYAHRHYLHHHFYAAVRGVRRVEAYKSAATAAASGTATTQAPYSPSKTVQRAPANSASPWTPMTVPRSPSPANEPPKSGVDSTEWAKKFELRLNQLSPDMWAASALLEQEGFRVDSGNKSATGWFLTAHDRNRSRGSIELQSDGTKIALTVTG
jgi:hypothetical protein